MSLSHAATKGFGVLRSPGPYTATAPSNPSVTAGCALSASMSTASLAVFSFSLTTQLLGVSDAGHQDRDGEGDQDGQDPEGGRRAEDLVSAGGGAGGLALTARDPPRILSML